MKSRMQYTMLNLTASFAVQPLRVLLGFVNRTVFITSLGVTYLSLSGLLTSILSVLSLAELGVGAAMSYALYKPLADDDHNKVTAYMTLYQKLYRIIGGIILALGILVSFFLPYFIKGQAVTTEVVVIYYLFLVNSVSSYFFGYKRTLIEADQKKYKITFVDFLIFLVGNLVQLIVLWLTKNYYFYLLCTILMTVVSNLVITMIVNREYDYLLTSEVEPITVEEKHSFIKNIKGIVVSRIGEMIVLGTDNILISSFVALNVVGIYSNYTYLLSILSGFMVMMLTSVKSSVANLIHERQSSTEKVIAFVRKYQFVIFMIEYFAGMGIMLFVNPVIMFWLGEQYIFAPNIVLVIAINFFITNYRSVYSSLIGIYGINYEQNIKVAVEIILNIVFSMGLLYYTDLGVIAILGGTILSSLLTVVWYEPYSVLKYGVKFFDSKLIRNSVCHYLLALGSIIGLYLLEVHSFLRLSRGDNLVYRMGLYLLIFILFSLVTYKHEGYQSVMSMIRRLLTLKRKQR